MPCSQSLQYVDMPIFIIMLRFEYRVSNVFVGCILQFDHPQPFHVDTSYTLNYLSLVFVDMSRNE